MSRVYARRAKSRSAVDRPVFILLILFLLAGAVTAVVAFVWTRDVVASWRITDIGGGAPALSASDPNKNPDASGDAAAPGDTTDNTPLQAVAGPTPQPWDGNTRITVLLMGLDFRDWEAGETPRTDTMMLATIDPLSKTAGMLSVPRDMWVNIPGFDYAKINTAYYLGEVYKMPGGGPALAMKTVENFLGTPINYYAQIDFMAFARFIDELGGLDIHVHEEEITVDPIGAGNTVKLKEGVQTLDGATTLAYARARYTEGGDFDRAKRQQEVLMAIRYQILTLNMLPTLVAKAPVLYQEISDGIHTNLTLDQIIQLAWLLTQVPEENIKRGVIGTNAVQFAKSPDGLDILIPVPDQIRLVRDEVFTANGPVSPMAQTGASAEELMRTEAARVRVLNGSMTEGLASRTAEYLRSVGMNVVEEGNADTYYANCALIDYTGKPYTGEYLSQLMGIATGSVRNAFDPNSAVDLTVIVGDDWANTNPMP